MFGFFKPFSAIALPPVPIQTEKASSWPRTTAPTLGLNAALTQAMEKACVQILRPRGCSERGLRVQPCSWLRGRRQLGLAGASSPARVEGVGRMLAGGVGRWDVLSRLGCRWLLRGLLRGPVLGRDGCLNGAVEVHPLINVVGEGLGGSHRQHPGKTTRVCRGTKKDSLERQLNESLKRTLRGLRVNYLLGFSIKSMTSFCAGVHPFTRSQPPGSCA